MTGRLVGRVLATDPFDAGVSALLPLADLKAWLHVDDDDEDEVISQIAAAAVRYVESNSGCYIVPSNLEFSFSCSPTLEPSGQWNLYGVPGAVIESVSYRRDGVLEQLPAANYAALAGAEPPFGFWLNQIGVWPVANLGLAYDRTLDPFRLNLSGVGVDPITADLRTAINLLVYSWYDNRYASEERRYSRVPFGVVALLSPYRQVRV